MSCSRRSFLRAAAGVGALTFTSRLGRSTSLALGPNMAKGTGNLILLQLSGGNDGLSTVVPYGDDAYQAARPELRMGKDSVLPLDDYRGLNPELKAMREAFESGELAIIEGCGYPDPNRSHFKSMEIWHAADARGRAAGDGWIGRLSDSTWKKETAVNRVINVGSEQPDSLVSKTHPSASFEIPEGYRWIENEGSLAGYEDEAGDQGEAKGALGELRRMLGNARDSSKAVRAAVGGYRTKVRYPDTDLGVAARSAAALLAGGIGTRVVSLTMGGFDTHNDEAARHGRQMRDLDAALGALRKDLAGSEAGKQTAVLIFSEFGRRVAENGSGGTDHGTAGPMFVMGSAVKGGLFGKHSSLTKLDEGDLIHTTDFRAVYGEVAAGLFGVKRDFLGRDYGRMELF